MLPVAFRYSPRSCINACIFCSNDQTSDYHLSEEELDLDLQRMKEQFLSYVASHDKDSICITGNDPIQLGLGRLIELLDLIHSNDFDIGFMSTHGRQLTKDTLQALKDHGLDVLQIPLYGSNALIHNGITRPKIGDAFLDAAATLELCEQLGIKVIGNIRITRENCLDIENINQLYRKLCPTSLVSINLGGIASRITENAESFLSKTEENSFIEPFLAKESLVTRVY